MASDVAASERGRLTTLGGIVHAGRLASKLVSSTLRTFLWPVFRLERWDGLEWHSKHPIRVAYLGGGESRRYLQDLIFGTTLDASPRDSFFWWRLRSATRRIAPAVDLVIIETLFPFPGYLNGPNMLRVPRWVKQHVPLAADWGDTVQGIRRKTRMEAQRLIRKYDYQTRITQSESAATRFYDKIYRPFVLDRYGATANVVGRRQFLRECRGGRILELLRDNKVVAASMIRQSGASLSIVWTGTQKAPDGKTPPGVSDVLDYCSLLYAHQLGCKYLDLGPTRPRLNDGLLNYKKKWGATLYTGKTPQGLFVLIPSRLSPPVQALLAQAKFITMANGRLVARVLVPQGQNRGEAYLNPSRDWIEGLESLRYYVWQAPSKNKVVDNPTTEIVSLQGASSPLDLLCR